MTFTKYNNRKTSLAVLLASTMAASVAASSGALAGANSADLNTWAEAANHSVDKVMYYPRTTIRGSGNGAAKFYVTVDRDGEVVASDQVTRIGSRVLNSAAKRVVKRADFPALPAGFNNETLTFVLKLNYGTSEKTKFSREGRVTSQKIAENASQNGVGITILGANAE